MDGRSGFIRSKDGVKEPLKGFARKRRDEIVDHIDGDPTNNRRSNLRNCTQHQNSMNSRKRKNDASSKYKGVSWDKGRKKWRAYINLMRKQLFLGRFDNELEAARAYNDKAVELYGEFAHLNKFKN